MDVEILTFATSSRCTGSLIGGRPWDRPPTARYVSGPGRKPRPQEGIPLGLSLTHSYRRRRPPFPSKLTGPCGEPSGRRAVDRERRRENGEVRMETPRGRGRCRTPAVREPPVAWSRPPRPASTASPARPDRRDLQASGRIDSRTFVNKARRFTRRKGPQRGQESFLDMARGCPERYGTEAGVELDASSPPPPTRAFAWVKPAAKTAQQRFLTCSVENLRCSAPVRIALAL